jgi:hypothetical protein
MSQVGTIDKKDDRLLSNFTNDFSGTREDSFIEPHRMPIPVRLGPKKKREMTIYFY